MSGSSNSNMIALVLSLGGLLMSTFGATVVPSKYHGFAFFSGLALFLAGFLWILLSQPFAYELVASGWPKRLTLGFGALFVISFAWWQLAPILTPARNVSFQKYALFWVKVDAHVYQLGTVIKLFSYEKEPHSVDEVILDIQNWTIFPRGSYEIRRLIGYEDRAKILEDNYIMDGAPALFKKLLPITFDLTIRGGDTPELVLRGSWTLKIGKRVSELDAPFYSVYPHEISEQEWADLLKPRSKIDIESLHFKEIPERPPDGAPDRSYLVYNLDRSAEIENPYFAQTMAARAAAGVMIFIRGKAMVPEDKGWVVLGHTYHDVWSDPEKLALYNSLYPPGEDGLPRAFGFFAGLQDEMAGPIDRQLAAPVTRAADILEFSSPIVKP